MLAISTSLSVDGGEDEHDIMICRLWMKVFVTVWLKLLWLWALLDLASLPAGGDGFLCLSLKASAREEYSLSLTDLITL